MSLEKKEQQKTLLSCHFVKSRYEDIDVGLKMTSYTVNGLRPGVTYLFTLCLRRGEYVIAVSSAALTTREPDFQDGLGIETDYASLFAVALVLAALASSCVGAGVARAWRYRAFSFKQQLGACADGGFDGGRHCACAGGGGSDGDSQREMIVATSPSERSSVNSYHSCQHPHQHGTHHGPHHQHWQQQHCQQYYRRYYQHYQHQYRQLASHSQQPHHRQQQPRRHKKTSHVPLQQQQQQQQQQSDPPRPNGVPLTSSATADAAGEDSMLVEHEVATPVEEVVAGGGGGAVASSSLAATSNSTNTTQA